jgi:uncharacterized protein DUF5818
MERGVRSLLIPVFLFTLLSVGRAQDSTAAVPNPDIRWGILGSPLIVWSYMQEPQPVSPPTAPPAGSQLPQQQRLQTLTGVILREGGKYVLKATDNSTYQFDDEDKVKPYEGRAVKIAGYIEAGGNTVRVAAIELAS